MHPMNSPSNPIAPPASELPQQIGRYRIEKVLSNDSFGTTYLGHDDDLQRLVAIKVPHPDLIVDPESLAAYLSEARRSAAVEHPNIVPVIEVGSTEAFPCFVARRFIDGSTLATRLAHSRPSHADSATMIVTVAQALEAAHRQHVVHGDIQPSNLLLDWTGTLFVSDFAPSLVSGQRMVGTPAYMSPEQIRGEDHRIDAHCDLFSLGIVFYEMLSGKRPFEADSLAHLTEAISAANPTPPRQIDPSIPLELERVCLKMLRRRVEERYGSAQELADELKASAVHLSKTALPDSRDSALHSQNGTHVVRSTFVFTDFKGFTDRVRLLEQTAGPRAAAEMKRTVAVYVEEALRQINNIVPPTEYRLIDTAGDGFFFHFHSAEGAYRFTAALQAKTAAHNRDVTEAVAEHWFRTGAATGDVAWDEDKPVGNVVNICSRHQAACAGGDFLIDESTFQDLPEELRQQFGLPETIRDKHGSGYLVRRTAFGRPLEPLDACKPSDAAQPQLKKVVDGPAAIVPKGLRSFDSRDSGFFLELVPGPRNHEGIPDMIRLMKARIEARHAADTFALGCVYGPSGSGKSSLVKAGLLPRLSSAIIPIFIEASAKDTESTLMNRLRIAFPQLPENGSLTQALTTLRRGTAIPAGHKVLIIIDQFEQWLQATSNTIESDLANALRQCDGTHLQCFVMVRDDFWITINRFVRDLDVRLVERVNSLMIDLFDRDHAARVLGLFGQAYGRLPDNPAAASKDQKQFLKDAIESLAVNNKIVPVRLALFAELIKNKPWTPGMLKEIGGAEGVGVAFLEETFSATNTSARFRHHQQAARNVLKSLLPEGNTAIRLRRTAQELLAASGYEKRPEDFTDLREMLDGELRLITAIFLENDENTVTKDSEDTFKATSYQLAHDFLVPSLRAWLTRGQKETHRGRAELLLADRATVWNARRENRQLPSIVQSLQIRWWTKRRDWTKPQRLMMRTAVFHRARIVSILLILIALAGWAAREEYGRIEAIGFRDRLLDAKIHEVPTIVLALEPFRRWINPLLKAAQVDSKTLADPQKQLAVCLAMLPVDASQAESLLEHLLVAKPEAVGVIVAALEPQKQAFVERLWSHVDSNSSNSQNDSRSLRAAAALATYDHENTKWDQAAHWIADLLIHEEPLDILEWNECFRPIKPKLIPPLEEIYRHNPSEVLRAHAARILATYCVDAPLEIVDLLLDTLVTRYRVLFPIVAAHAEIVIPMLTAELDRILPADGDASLCERFSKRQANAAVMLMLLHRPDKAWALLKHSPNPSVRSYMIDRIGTAGVNPAMIADRLDHETDLSAQRALLLSLGSYPEGSVSPSVRLSLLPKVQAIYQTDPDPGLHAASEWLLRMWKEEPWLQTINQEWQKESHSLFREIAFPVATTAAPAGPQWYVTSQGQTMVILPGPVEFMMGSSRDDVLSNFSDPVHPKRIGRTYAIANKTVSIEQFQTFDPTYSVPARFSRLPDLPAIRIDWHRAAAYCNHLSEKEGIAQEQWCYEKSAHANGTTMLSKKNMLSLTGYRLPTEAEFEYATRAGAVTAHSYGESHELLDRYAWFALNSEGVTWPMGQLKPNDLGLFDTTGNVLEWSQNIYRPDAHSRQQASQILDDIEDQIDPKVGESSALLFRSQRGGSFMHSWFEAGSASRTNYSLLDDATDYTGFRVARTIALTPLPSERENP